MRHCSKTKVNAKLTLKCHQKKSNRKKKWAKRKHEIRNNTALKMIIEIRKTIFHFFPTFYDKLKNLPDVRKNPDYQIQEVILAAIAPWS